MSKKNIDALRKVLRSNTFAWNVCFYVYGGVRPYALLGAMKDIKAWAKPKAEKIGSKRWFYEEFPEFNFQYAGKLSIPGCPDWHLLRRKSFAAAGTARADEPRARFEEDGL